jgi:transketolase
MRPAEATETAEVWRIALENKSGPSALILSRQGVPTLDRERYASAEGVHKGAYILSDVGEPQVILVGTGTEVQMALEARAILAREGVRARVVSMPSWELFQKQSTAYKESVFPAAVTARVAVEAGVTLGWERYVGSQGKMIGIDHFGASAPYKTIYEKFGLTAEAVAEAALTLID